MKNERRTKSLLALILIVTLVLSFTPALAEGYTAIISETMLPVYSDANLTQQAGQLAGFTVVTVDAVKGDVARIQYGKYTLFADATALVDIEDIAIPAVVSQDTRVYQQPNLNSRHLALQKGLEVNVLYISDENWAMIEKDGHVGYTYVAHLAPSTSGDGDESEDDPFLPDGEGDDNTSDGNSSVVIETVPARVSVSALQVYQKASTSSKLLGTINEGQEVTVYAYNRNWAYIGLNGRYGFCALAGLVRIDDDSDGDDGDLSGAVSYTVTASSVKIYESASSDSKSLGTLRKGVEVNLVKSNGEWAYIELNGKYGYCALDALTKTSELTPDDSDNNNSGEIIDDHEPLGTATVIQATAPVYSSMNASKPSSTLKLGETVSFYGYDSKWVLIGKNYQFGFIPRQYLSAESYAELEAEDSGAAVKDLQNALLELGYLDAVPSVNYSSLTTEAVSRLQAACGLTQTGKADLSTLRVLYSGNAPYSPMLSTSLSKGDKNDNVRRLQTRLYALGYLSRSSSIDGDYGSTTAAAVLLFQKAAGLSASGSAENATVRALYHSAAPSLPSGSDAADATQNSGGSSGGSSGNTTEMGDLASTTDHYDPSMSNAQKLEYVIYVAQQQLGKKYVFGAAGTSTYDCSGLTLYCFKQVGVSLQHSAYGEGYNSSHQKISSISGLRRGDLVFFNTISDGDQCDHVGIYLGNNYFIHASSGAGKVVVSNLASGYYNRVFSWGRRILG